MDIADYAFRKSVENTDKTTSGVVNYEDFITKVKAMAEEMGIHDYMIICGGKYAFKGDLEKTLRDYMKDGSEL